MNGVIPVVEEKDFAAGGQLSLRQKHLSGKYDAAFEQQPFGAAFFPIPYGDFIRTIRKREYPDRKGDGLAIFLKRKQREVVPLLRKRQQQIPAFKFQTLFHHCRVKARNTYGADTAASPASQRKVKSVLSYRARNANQQFVNYPSPLEHQSGKARHRQGYRLVGRREIRRNASSEPYNIAGKRHVLQSFHLSRDFLGCGLRRRCRRPDRFERK